MLVHARFSFMLNCLKLIFSTLLIINSFANENDNVSNNSISEIEKKGDDQYTWEGKLAQQNNLSSDNFGEKYTNILNQTISLINQIIRIVNGLNNQKNQLEILIKNINSKVTINSSQQLLAKIKSTAEQLSITAQYKDLKYADVNEFDQLFSIQQNKENKDTLEMLIAMYGYSIKLITHYINLREITINYINTIAQDVANIDTSMRFKEERLQQLTRDMDRLSKFVNVFSDLVLEITNEINNDDLEIQSESLKEDDQQSEIKKHKQKSKKIENQEDSKDKDSEKIENKERSKDKKENKKDHKKAQEENNDEEKNKKQPAESEADSNKILDNEKSEANTDNKQANTDNKQSKTEKDTKHNEKLTGRPEDTKNYSKKQPNKDKLSDQSAKQQNSDKLSKKPQDLEKSNKLETKSEDINAKNQKSTDISDTSEKSKKDSSNATKISETTTKSDNQEDKQLNTKSKAEHNGADNNEKDVTDAELKNYLINGEKHEKK